MIEGIWHLGCQPLSMWVAFRTVQPQGSLGVTREHIAYDHTVGRKHHPEPACSSLLPTGERRRRGKQDRRSAEISLVIRGSLEQTIMVELLPRSQIDIYVQVS